MNTNEDPPVDPPFLRGLWLPLPTHTHTHWGRLIGSNGGYLQLICPPTTITTNRSKAVSVGDEEEKCEGLDRDHRETRARRFLLEPRPAALGGGGGGGGGVERVEKVVSCVCVSERVEGGWGELSVMLSVCGAGCDKRSSVAAGWYLSLPPSLYLTHTHTV